MLKAPVTAFFAELNALDTVLPIDEAKPDNDVPPRADETAFEAELYAPEMALLAVLNPLLSDRPILLAALDNAPVIPLQKVCEWSKNL